MGGEQRFGNGGLSLKLCLHHALQTLSHTRLGFSSLCSLLPQTHGFDEVPAIAFDAVVACGSGFLALALDHHNMLAMTPGF
ncbi:hypothetical protein SDC9_197143 [bioreactor metagenome]|uniref:Uncharacterized protein n=1 Tax=bioreactor metagenome TaxID=1076179 RepID=A0A645IFB5_9ZZZZ